MTAGAANAFEISSAPFEMRSLLSLVFVTLCALAVFAQRAPKESPIIDSAAGADFVARSEVDPGSSSGFKLTNTIRNRAATPLAVDWPAGGVYCARSHPLPARAPPHRENTGDSL